MAQLTCPDCTSPLASLAVLAAATTAWSHGPWILFTCASCGQPSHLEVHDGRLGIGKLDGAPGPVWIPHAVTVEPDLTVERGGSVLTVRLPPHVFRYPTAS